MPIKIKQIIEFDLVEKYLVKRNLLEIYKKQKNKILNGKLKSVNFKLRQPKKDKKYQFRINKQFRALCFFEKTKLTIFKIDNHQ